jgi:hypothetical protein
MDPTLGKMLVTQLVKRGFMHFASYGWPCLPLKKIPMVTCSKLSRTEANSEDRVRLNLTHTERDKFLTSTHCDKLAYFRLPHTHPHRQSLQTPQPAVLMQRGLRIPNTDGNIWGWKRYEKTRKNTLSKLG